MLNIFLIKLVVLQMNTNLLSLEKVKNVIPLLVYIPLCYKPPLFEYEPPPLAPPCIKKCANHRQFQNS